MPRCVLIADDLTGACDSAVQFKLRGVRSVVHLDLAIHGQSDACVRAFNTDTRDAGSTEMEQRIRQVAELTLAANPQLIFKKIDSLLRGNPGREIRTALEAFGCDVAIVTPAFPEMGRTVRDGHLEVHDDNSWERLEVVPLLRRQGLEECAHLTSGTLGGAIEQGARYISLDITAHHDLECMVVEALGTGKKILWAGSGGLASALAGVLFSGNKEREPPKPVSLPVVFCIGSDHPVTTAQLAFLQNQCRTVEIDAGARDPKSFVHELGQGRHVILRIPRRQVSRERLQLVFQDIKGGAAAILLSGGDTASAVCHALDAREIEIVDQVVAGLPWGTLHGGLLHGLPVATKSGAFGRAADLMKVADFFTCLNK